MSRLPDQLVQIYSRHAVYLEGAKSRASRELEAFLRDVEADVLAHLSKVESMDSLKGRRLTALLKAVRGTLDEGLADYEKAWRKVLAELAEYEGGFTTRALGEVVNTDFTLPTPAQMLTAAFARPLDVTGIDGGSLLGDFFANWSEKTKQRVEGAIRMSVAQGESLTQLIQRMRGTKARRYKDGLFEGSRREMALMARTAYHHVATQARASVYGANGDIVASEEFVAVLDGRTSATCRGLSGQRFKVGEGPQPPLHIACRSMRVPRLRNGLDIMDGAGKQFSRGADGIQRVSGDMDYYEWLTTQPAGFQDSVLGPTRGKLLRKGGLSAERFRQLQLDKVFQERTLQEMRDLEPLAFERAGI